VDPVISDASNVAARIRRQRDDVARRVTDEFLERHPDWVERYGARARQFGEEDARFHVDFLAAAVLGRSKQAFEEYARWTAALLSARGIAAAFLEENLEQVGRAVEGLLDVEEAAWVRDVVDAGRRAAVEPVVGATDQGALAAATSVFVEAALVGDRRAAWTVVSEALREGVPMLGLYRDVLQEAQYELGRRWASNRITVTQEHTATAVTQFVLARLYEKIPRPRRVRGTVVVTGVGGEQHSLGAQIVADTLEMDGWDVRYLGTAMPHQGIVDAVGDARADIVAISATMLFCLPAVEDLVQRVRERFPAGRPRILLGGGAFVATPDLWRSLGVDGQGTNLDEAMTLARDVHPGPSRS